MSLRAELTVDRSELRMEASFAVDDGQALAIVGPNGAGKSTLLGALAGLVPMTVGMIELDGERIEDRPPERRRVGMCFQDAALFPRLSALENVAFPLRAHRRPKDESRRIARDLLAELAPHVDTDAVPAALSGGEQQRVALARALAADPRLLLLDEPLAAVDVTARAELRRVIRRAIARFEGPCIVVAHDPVDALTLGDRVAILEAGRITQQGTPETIRNAPATGYAADLVGLNLFEGSLEPVDADVGHLETGGGRVIVSWPRELPRRTFADVVATIPPSEVSLHLARPEGSARNVLRGPIGEVAIHGDRARVRVRSAPPITAEVTIGSVERLGLRDGLEVFASCKAVEVQVRVEASEPDTLGT